MPETCPNCGVGIDEHEAGRCLDAWWHQLLGRPVPVDHDWHNPHCDCFPHYSTTWSGLGLVMTEVNRRLFSFRYHFLKVLDDEITKVVVKYSDGPRPGRIMWPDAILRLTPLAAVRAAIKATKEG